MADYDYDREGDRDLDLVEESRSTRAHRTRRHSTSRSPVITNGSMDLDRAPSPPRPSVSSRMSLSALVNSPPPPASVSPPSVTRSSRQAPLSPPTRSSSSRYSDYPPPSRYEPGYMSRSSRSIPSSSEYYGVPRDVGRSYLHRGDHSSRADMSYESPETSRYERAPSYDTTHEYSTTVADPYESRRLRSSGRSSGRRSGGGPGPSSYASYRSPSPPLAPPAFQPYQPSGWRNGGGHERDRDLDRDHELDHDHDPEHDYDREHERDESPLPPAASSPVSDRHRSPEPSSAPAAAETIPANLGRKVLRHDDSLEENQDVWQEHLRTFQQRREHEANEILYWTPDLGDGKNVTVKVPTKRKGWPADHPTRIAQRQAKEAALAAGQELPKKKYKRKSKVSSAAIDDELLGLAEGDMVAASSPMPASSVHDGDDDHIPSIDPNALVWPSGLTRAEVIAKIEANDMRGLTEDDVKQVQDEMWLKKNGPAARRKDGTMRKKPGPAKGWKRMRRLAEKAEKAARGEAVDSDGDESMLNGEADADIAALLDDGSEAPPKKRRQSKKKKSVAAADVTVDDIINSEIDEIKADDDAAPATNGDAPPPPPPPKKRSGKAKEPGVGKGRWTRPPKQPKIKAKEEKKEAAAAAAREEVVSAPPPPPPPPRHQPNTYDPRGVSEREAEVRLNLVEEIQRQVWASIIRDVPRVYRVNQAYDNAVKQDAARTAQACQRNLLNSRNLRPSHRSAKSNKDANAKAKRVMREMMVYWRKNEKDEVAARKRAEKEALEKAKAEEEARESKRQARKLNFLLTQTELYSHFIGKKIKTNEAEEMEGGESTPVPDAPNGVSGDLEDLAAGEEKELDFDDDDEENLRRHAARGALATMQASRQKAAEFDKKADDPMDADELDFQNPNLGENQVTITQPKRLMAQLKEYQLKGLTWLGNLYEQGINGILADEMGLGKTIQSISLLAYLAEVHNLWGPFLVIAPSSTLHNWQQELTRFVPHLKALPYWGSPKDRETLRRIWNRKNQTFTEDSPFHILVTSYQLAVQDEKYFQMMRWQYMILDEAQAIKSSSSARWKSLLSFNCRNRLLLTGTPIQNSMHELWALLHFIMPSLFDSHEEFSEWFSKDIENAGSGNGQLKPEQLKRLHTILKPFMLRRVKKHVQKELGDKIEIDVLVDLSQRQREIYKRLRSRISIADLMKADTNDSAATKNLMNLVMQFRKVCNHPDLFERADVRSPFLFGSFSQSGNLARQGDNLYCPASAKNAIEVTVPRILWEEGGVLTRPSEDSLAGSDTYVLHNLMNIWSTEWINTSLKDDQSPFAFLKVMDMSPAEAHRRAKAHPLVQLLDKSEDKRDQAINASYKADHDFAASSSKKFTPIEPRVPNAAPVGTDLPPLRDITRRFWNQSYMSRRPARFAQENAIAPPIRPIASSRSYVNTQERLANDPLVHSALYGAAPSERDDPDAAKQLTRLAPGVSPTGLLEASAENQVPRSSIMIPPPQRLIVDSAKLARLDDLLRELKAGGHRVLLYFQMTKMMDLIEEYLIYRQYKYLRLDGSSAIGDRRDMVTSWQTNPDIFVFCLSTRAGGLGINLTAADTVIFYDHDWNPSNDAQAMDRAHRVGQTKQVTVYRLIARGTIEERIVKLARAKKDVQDIVVGAKSVNDVAKPTEIASLFMDDEDVAESMAKRKQAEAHGYVAPAFGQAKRSAFGDGLDLNDDEGDDFFTAANKNQQQDDDDDDATPSGSGARTPQPKKGRAKKGEGAKPKGRSKKVKIALGPDGLPL